MNKMKKITWMLAVVLGLLIAAPALPADGPSYGPGGPGMNRQSKGFGGHRRGRGRRRKTLTAEQEKQVIEFAGKYMEKHYDRLLKLRDDNELAYRRTLAFLWPRVQQMLALPEDIRQAHVRKADLRMEIFQAAKTYRKAETSEEKQECEEQLKKLLAQSFDIEQKLHEYRLKELADQIEQLEKELKQRVEDRRKIIDEQMERIIKAREKMPRRKWAQPRTDEDKKTKEPPATKVKTEKPEEKKQEEKKPETKK